MVNDEAHVRLVDPHAEGDGRHDSLQLPVGPLVVYLAPSGSLWTKVSNQILRFKGENILIISTKEARLEKKARRTSHDLTHIPVIGRHSKTGGVELIRQCFHIFDGEGIDDTRAVSEFCGEHVNDASHALVVRVRLGANLVEEVRPVEWRLELEAPLEIEDFLAVGCDLLGGRTCH